MKRDRQSVGTRPRGLWLLAAVVACGLLPAAWFHWFVPREQKRVVGALAAVPGEPGARLDAWLAYGEPMIQTRLQKLRFSTAHPWLVTHTRRTATGEPEIWGLDLDTPSPAQLVRAGLRVEVRLPAPRALGRGELAGSDAERVPSYGPGESPPDPAVRAGMLVEWFLAGMIEAVAEDIEGAELVVRIGASPPHAPGDGG